MSRARLIVETCPSAGETIRLSREQSAHARAMRLSAGDEVLLLDGSGVRAFGRLTSRPSGTALVTVERVEPARPLDVDLSLAVAGVRIERLSWIAEKATELGVSRFSIVRTERTQSFRAREDVAARLARVAREAAKQCESSRWPAVLGPVSLEEALASAESPNRFLFDPDGEAFPARLRENSAALLIGPEGGWTDSEKRTALRHAWSIVSIPAGKLRSETAAVAALILARAALTRGAPSRKP